MQKSFKTRLLLLSPLVGFGILVFFLGIGFGLGEHHVHPSAMLNDPFPEFESLTLFEDENINQRDIVGTFRLVNVWASWCTACVEEHDLLLELARSGQISIIGVNYRDQAEDAKTWLYERGNPYEKIIVDAEGELCIDLGVYGAPESFLVDPEGIIRAKQVGVLTRTTWMEKFQPWLQTQIEQQ